MCFADEVLRESNKLRFLDTLDIFSGPPHEGQVEMVVSAKGGMKHALSPTEIVQLVLWRNYFRSINTEPEFESEPITAPESLGFERTACGVARTFDCDDYVPAKIEALNALIVFAVSRDVFSLARFKHECSLYGSQLKCF